MFQLRLWKLFLVLLVATNVVAQEGMSPEVEAMPQEPVMDSNDIPRIVNEEIFFHPISALLGRVRIQVAPGTGIRAVRFFIVSEGNLTALPLQADATYERFSGRFPTPKGNLQYAFQLIHEDRTTESTPWKVIQKNPCGDISLSTSSAKSQVMKLAYDLQGEVERLRYLVEEFKRYSPNQSGKDGSGKDGK
jgi:hypothetical protein